MWIHRPYDNSFYANHEWLSAQVWVARGETKWSARVDVMNARHVPSVVNTHRVQAEGGFGRTYKFDTVEEAKAYADRRFDVG